jgi:hypothetical protein
MDDCDYDLQIVLCAFDSMEDVLVNFDIDACRIAYDGTRLVASETFLRAVVSGVVIARPQIRAGYNCTHHAEAQLKNSPLYADAYMTPPSDLNNANSPIMYALHASTRAWLYLRSQFALRRWTVHGRSDEH